MDALATPWVNARAAHLLAVHRMMPMEVGDDQEEKFDSNDDDPLMYTQKAETLELFSSHIIPVKTGKAYLGECIHVMIQGPTNTGWHFASRPDCTEHIYQAEKGQ